MKTTLKIIAISTATATLLTACAGLPMSGATGTSGTGTSSTPTLQGGTWDVQSINGVAVNSSIHPSLVFGSTMQLTGHTSCNTYVSGYVASSLGVLKGIVTKMACDDAVMNQETRFLQQLNNTQMWNIDANGKLNLVGSAGNMVAVRK